jgi:alanine-synthesizing transaminase
MVKECFSNRTRWDLTPNPLSRLLDEKRHEGVTIINLTESNPTACGFEYPKKEILEAFSSEKIMEYHPHPKGVLACREIIADYYKSLNIPANPENIFLTASSSEAYAWIFRLLANPGDRILVPSPSYPLFDFLAQLNDIEIEYYPLEYDETWKIDFGTLSNKISPKTKAILLVHPNNPTGSYVSEEERVKLNQIASRNNLALVSDEVFFDYVFDHGQSSFSSFAGNKEVLTFALNGISKMLALPQMKLGWMVVDGPESLRKAAVEKMEIIADTYLSVNTPIQTAFPEIMKLKTGIQKQILARLNQNKKTLFEIIQNHPSCEYLKSEGGWYALLKVPKIRTDDEWTLTFLKHDDVLIHPGHFYNFDQEGYLVISLLGKNDDLDSGLNKIFSRISSS